MCRFRIRQILLYFRSLLSKGGTVFVKKRIGQLPYDKDPKVQCENLKFIQKR